LRHFGADPWGGHWLDEQSLPGGNVNNALGLTGDYYGSDGCDPFGKSASHVSDVRFNHTLSPDNKALTILFDNFSVQLRPGGAPVAARMVSLVFPLADVTTGAEVSVHLRGFATLEAGATGTVIFRAFGQTQPLEPLFERGDSNFTKSLSLKVPTGSNADITLVLIVERGNSDHDAIVTLDSIDIGIEPAAAK
jgi:hypothetical protein